MTLGRSERYGRRLRPQYSVDCVVPNDDTSSYKPAHKGFHILKVWVQAEPFNQKDRPVAPSKVISLRSRRFPGGVSGMKTPSAKRMPSHSPSAGHSAILAFVSGPRTVRNVWSRSRVTTISK